MRKLIVTIVLGLATITPLCALSREPIDLPENLADALALLRAQPQEKRALQSIGSGWVIVPTAANNPGQFGAYFKTRVTIAAMPASSTALTVPLTAYLFTPTGRRSISLRIGDEIVTWENVLQDLFGYQGAGAVLFDTDIIEDILFVTAEVYVDGPNGRFSTAVDAHTILDDIGSYPDLSVGVTVNSSTRANLGCSSATSSSQSITATMFGDNGFKVKAFNFTLPGYGWVQIPVDAPVNRGIVIWQSSGYYAFCWVVNVDNTSNDGTFIGRTTYVP